MSKEKGIGDNPITEEAIKFIKNIYENLTVQQKYSEKGVNGKNKTIRDNNALKSVLQCWKMLKDLKPWYKVIEAKENGVDIDSDPIKSSKLEIVAGSNYKFGQYIIDGEIVPPLFEEDDHDQTLTRRRSHKRLGWSAGDLSFGRFCSGSDQSRIALTHGLVARGWAPGGGRWTKAL